MSYNCGGLRNSIRAECQKKMELNKECLTECLPPKANLDFFLFLITVLFYFLFIFVINPVLFDYYFFIIIFHIILFRQTDVNKDVLCLEALWRPVLTQVWSLAGRVSLAGLRRRRRAVRGAGLDRVDQWDECARRIGSGFGHGSDWCRVTPLWKTTPDTGKKKWYSWYYRWSVSLKKRLVGLWDLSEVILSPWIWVVVTPEYSSRRKRPKQRWILHCFLTFSFIRQWKRKMKSPET